MDAWGTIFHFSLASFRTARRCVTVLVLRPLVCEARVYVHCSARNHKHNLMVVESKTSAGPCALYERLGLLRTHTFLTLPSFAVTATLVVNQILCTRVDQDLPVTVSQGLGVLQIIKPLWVLRMSRESGEWVKENSCAFVFGALYIEKLHRLLRLA